MTNDWITRLSEYVATGEGIAWIVGLVVVPPAVWTVGYARKQLTERRRLQERRIDPLCPPVGFSPIERDRTGTLRDFLSSEKQPYYSWSRHQKSVPFSEAGCVADEHELLDTLLQNDAKPLLLTGEGGCGKTRLALELCRMARSRKSPDEQWLAFAINSTIRESDLLALIDRLKASSQRLVLILDYVETLESALSFNRIHEMVKAEPQHLRLVATCRRTYYENTQTCPTRFRDGYSLVLNLNEAISSAYGRWLAGWREAACRAIESSGRKVTIPALAVILRYLREKKMNPGAWRQGKEDEWVNGILTHSVRTHTRNFSPSSEELARLLALFRMPHVAWNSIATNDPQSEKILDAWKRDGWITSVSGRKEGADQDGYELGHDLLCDLPLLWHLKQSPNLLKVRLDSLWNYACEYGAERSFFITIKRNLPTLALHFNIAQLLDPTRNSERTEPIHPEEPERAAKVQSMTLTSLSLSLKEKDRVFDATYELPHFKLTALEKVFEEEREKFTELAQKYPGDISLLLVRNAPVTPMLWFFMSADGYLNDNIPSLRPKLQMHYEKYLNTANDEIESSYEQEGESYNYIHDDTYSILCDIQLFRYLLKTPEQLKPRLEYLWKSAYQKGEEQDFFTTLGSNLPAIALHFNIVQLADPSRSSERREPIHLHEPQRAAKVQSMVLTSLSLSPDEKDRVFDATFDLSHFQLTELEKTFEEEHEKFIELGREHPDDISLLLIRNAPDTPMLWFFMSNGGYLSENFPSLRPKLQEWFSVVSNRPSTVPPLSRLFALEKALEKSESETEIQGILQELLHLAEQYDAVLIHEQCAKALMNKGVELGRQGRNDEEIAVFELIDERYGKSDRTELQVQCAKALVNKGVELSRQGRNVEEIAVYELIDERYGKSDRTELQVQCAKALVNKGVMLWKLGKEGEALGVFDQIDERYGHVDDSNIQALYLSATENSVELYLLTGRFETAIQRARKAEALLDGDNNNIAIMRFYRWLAEDSDVTVKGIVQAIERMPETEQFTWGFDETKPYYQRLDGQRKAVAEAFTDFFENALDRRQLKERVEMD
jgi:tetratricopeptide (TPR) repeat protein